MTYQSQVQVQTLEPGAMGTTDDGQVKPQNIIVGPVAAVIPIKQIGTNGGGFYGANAAAKPACAAAGTKRALASPP